MKLFRIKITVLIISLLLPFASLQAQVWNQIGNVIKGAAAEDFFGSSVSLSADGLMLAIGAPENDGNGTNAGHVRIFENQGGAWNQIGSAIDGEAAWDYFGWSTSLSADGSIVAIGAPYRNNLNGSVRIFENQAGGWSQIGAFEGEGLGGYSICLNADGSVVAIGDPSNDGNGYEAGHVRIFENQGGSWNQIGNAIEGIAAEDFFGASLCLSADGSVVAIGAPENDSFNTNAGHVRIFENQGGSWNQIGNAVEGIAAEDKLGSSVSLNASGSILATGAPENDANGTNAGFVGVFENSAVSRESIQQQSFSFYPNPTTGSFQIKGITTGSEEIKIEVYDMSGKTVFTKEYNDDSPTVNIANLTPGIYFVKLTAKGQTAVRKVVKL